MIEPLAEEISEARGHPNGWVYRIAGGFSATDTVPPEAIVGAWKVNAAGEITGQFVANARYDPERWSGKTP